MTFYERLLLPENLYYAWKKAKYLYRISDGYIDNGELAKFELDLENQLEIIQHRFRDCTYCPKEIRPLPRPKKLENSIPRNRQYFHVSVLDQVAWIAIVNALGPELDGKMPPWSYGNRLYRPAWYENENTPQSKLEIGPYRHSRGYLYRKFQHSWPLFRRHIMLTARTMVGARFKIDNEEIDEGFDLDKSEKFALVSAKAQKLFYLDKGFWPEDQPKENNTDIFHLSFDLKLFFPNISVNAILRGMWSSIGENSSEFNKIIQLLEYMLQFPIDMSGISNSILCETDPKIKGDMFYGIPTGLFVGGFLANVAMLPVDNEVNRQTHRCRNIAHFRYVDDHTILAYEFDQLWRWVDRYKKILRECKVGVEINEDKYSPESFVKWSVVRETNGNLAKEAQDVKLKAFEDTKIDGASPTKIITNTLQQVSLIATTDVNLLDDKDLENRFQTLKWLLLADISEHEIRPDTRAAFAASRIVALAPLLVPEAERLVEDVRSYEFQKSLKSKIPKCKTKEYTAKLNRLKMSLVQSEKLQINTEKWYYRECFNLLLQAFDNNPTKPRLFYQLHLFCQKTGYQGLNEIGNWINKIRNKKYTYWADYYCGLTFQIVANGILHAYSSIVNDAGLRSEKRAAIRYLKDVTNMNVKLFRVNRNHDIWFYDVARRELFVSILSLTECFIEFEESGEKIKNQMFVNLLNEFDYVSFYCSSEQWKQSTGYTSGVWAHIIEKAIKSVECEDQPSSVWKKYETIFDFNLVSDRRAARRYPEHLSREGKNYFLQEQGNKSDSGWKKEMITQRNVVKQVKTANIRTINLVSRYLSKPRLDDYISVTNWTEYIRKKCNDPFDPRSSEWTAIEIVRQLIEHLVNQLDEGNKITYIHPDNVLIPARWMNKKIINPIGETISWESWRFFLKNSKPGQSVEIINPLENHIVDYRYSHFPESGLNTGTYEELLTSIGRLLLGLLRTDHRAPRIWNIRGNEKVYQFPLPLIYRSLAISSSTLLILDSCLSGRSTETRTISRLPSLFGWSNDREVNDIGFDPPLLEKPEDLLEEVEKAQKQLEEHQLAVSLNNPRQLIPFQIKHIAVGKIDNEDEDLPF